MVFLTPRSLAAILAANLKRAKSRKNGQKISKMSFFCAKIQRSQNVLARHTPHNQLSKNLDNIPH